MTNPADWATPLQPGPPVLITGAAGFVGFFLAEKLTQAGVPVVGLDNLNDYYDPALKHSRLDILHQSDRFQFVEADLADANAINAVFAAYRPAHVVNLAAQAGVRYSIDNPGAYASANLTGFLNILEACRHHGGAHLVYASSSSVYGGNKVQPFSVKHGVDHPVSLYAATKKANELMAHTYSHLYGLPTTGLRFFTVYGPWGRPDMAYFKFAEKIRVGQPIQIYNNGDMERDFTYIDDIVEGVARLIPRPAQPDHGFDPDAPTPGSSWAPYRVYNIGNRRKERLMDMISILERELGQEAIKEYLPMQPGDVQATWADIDDLEDAVGFSPNTPLSEGLARFVQWHKAWRQD